MSARVDGVASRVQSAIQMRQVNAMYIVHTLYLFVMFYDHVCIQQ